jgi:hypothetical protein
MRVSYEGDLDAAQAYLGKAQHELDRLRTRMKTQGVEQGRFQHALADDAYCYGSILPGGIEMIHIVTTPGVSPVSSIELRTIPDFLSGVSLGHIIENDPVGGDVMSAFYPTPDCVYLHGDEVGTAWETARLSRFAVTEDAAFEEFRVPGAQYTMSQYHYLKPAMYSGTMKKVVQALLGFGRQLTDGDGNPLSVYGDIIDANSVLSETVGEERELTAYESSVKDNGVQIRYDFRSFRTHGICFDSDNNLWLVEISMNRGGIAMRLPLHEGTTGIDFYNALDELGDVDGLTLLDEFGGFPTGENFPGVNATVEAFIRAGKIVRLLPTSETDKFYWHQPYATAMGWAFNKSGTEAHNTAYYFADDDRQRGVHYAINLNFGAPANKIAREVDATLSAAIGDLRSKPEFEDIIDAAIYKLAYMDEDDYTAVLMIEGAEAALRYVDALILEPEVAATASLAKCSEGNLYWPSKIQPEIKFPDYVLRACISHDLRPGFAGRYKPLMYCDTVMHVFFVEDELKYCKLYINPDQTSETKVEGSDEYDITWNPIGRFERETVYGPFGVPAMFYTNDIDDRDELGDQTKYEHWERTDRGWIAIISGMVFLQGPYDWNNNAGPLDPDFWEGGDYENHKRIIQKVKWFWYKGWGDTTVGRRMQGAICIPLGDRNAMFYAVMRKASGETHDHNESAGFLSSPHIGHHYAKIENTRHECAAMAGPGDSALLQPEEQYHTVDNENAPYQHFQDIADIGDWVRHCTPFADSLYGQDAMTRVNQMGFNTHVTAPAKAQLDVTLICENTNVIHTKTRNKTGVDASLWDPQWFTPSPDDYGLTATIHATENALGTSKLAVYTLDINSGEMAVSGGPQPPIMQNVLLNFHGVING